MSQSKFDEYESNPGSLDVDEDNVEQLISQFGDESEAEDESGTKAADAETTDKGDESDKQESADEDKADDKAADDSDRQKKAEERDQKGSEEDEPRRVVKTRDGKHEIPYSVLERERQEKLTAQREVEAARKELDEIKRQQEALKRQAPDHEGDQVTGQSADKDDFDLNAFREEFGDDLAEVEKKRREEITAMKARQRKLEEELSESRKWREQQEAQAKQSAESQVAEAIDSVPELREWRDNEDPMWDAAVALDNRMRVDPAYADLSLRERFVEVVNRLNGRSSPAKKTDNKSAEEALDKTLAEQEKSGGKPPSSLSDIPGGHAVDQSEHDTLERMTTAQLERKFESMTPEQQSEYLARL